MFMKQQKQELECHLAMPASLNIDHIFITFICIKPLKIIQQNIYNFMFSFSSKRAISTIFIHYKILKIIWYKIYHCLCFHYLHYNKMNILVFFKKDKSRPFYNKTQSLFKLETFDVHVFFTCNNLVLTELSVPFFIDCNV